MGYYNTCYENTARTVYRIVSAHMIGLKVNLIYPLTLRIVCVFKVHYVLNAYRVQTEKEIVVASNPVLGYLLYLFRARRVSSINVMLHVRVFCLYYAVT